MSVHYRLYLLFYALLYTLGIGTPKSQGVIGPDHLGPAGRQQLRIQLWLQAVRAERVAVVHLYE